MTYKQFKDLIIKYHANPKTCGHSWDGEKHTYFSLEHGNNKIIANRDPDDIWEVVVVMGNIAYSTFINDNRLFKYIETCLGVWDKT